jgi:hypothetical protein
MGVTKRRLWKFSPGGAALFMLLVVVPLIVGLLRHWPAGGATRWWTWPLFLSLALFLIIFAWFGSLRALIQQGLSL